MILFAMICRDNKFQYRLALAISISVIVSLVPGMLNTIQAMYKVTTYLVKNSHLACISAS